MISKEELDKIEKEIKKSSKDYFKQKPKDIEEELIKESTLGTPDNLTEPADTDES
jgi:hypothetical protein